MATIAHDRRYQDTHVTVFDAETSSDVVAESARVTTYSSRLYDAECVMHTIYAAAACVGIRSADQPSLRVK